MKHLKALLQNSEFIKSRLENFAQNSESIERHEELKTLICEMTRLISENSANVVMGDKCRELTALVECLVQSSISADYFREVKTLIDTVVVGKDSTSCIQQNNVIESQLNVISGKMEQIYAKFDTTEQLCAEIVKFVSDIALPNDSASREELCKQLSIVEKLRGENEKYREQMKVMQGQFDNENKK